MVEKTGWREEERARIHSTKQSSIFPVWAGGLRAPLPVGLLTGGITMHHGSKGGLCVHYLQDLSKLSFLLPNSIKEPLTRPRFVIMSL